MPEKIRVLVVDDSALMRMSISEMLNSDPEIEVIATARRGKEAIEKVGQLRPEVVTMDIAMPDVDGLEALGYIMSEYPTPVIMVSAYTKSGAKTTLKALELGAVDFVPKPSGEISLDIDKIKSELISKVKVAAKVSGERLQSIFVRKARKDRQKTPPEPRPLPLSFKKVVAIGASTGGPRALAECLPGFPSDIPATFLIVQHMPREFIGPFAERLAWRAKIKVKEAEDEDKILPAQALIAPGGYHMMAEKTEGKSGEVAVVRLNQGPPVHSVRPSVDVMMSSVARAFGPSCIGVLLTGMGEDGVEGLRAIKEHGGQTIAEHESSCVVYGMPKVAIKEEVVDKVLPLSRIPIEIVKMLYER